MFCRITKLAKASGTPYARGTPRRPFQKRLCCFGRKKAFLLKQFKSEASEEVIRESEGPLPVEEYCTTYDGTYHIPGFRNENKSYEKRTESNSEHVLGGAEERSQIMVMRRAVRYSSTSTQTLYSKYFQCTRYSIAKMYSSTFPCTRVLSRVLEYFPVYSSTFPCTRVLSRVLEYFPVYSSTFTCPRVHPKYAMSTFLCSETCQITDMLPEAASASLTHTTALKQPQSINKKTQKGALNKRFLLMYEM
ncbi:unnamed protein product [Brassicogethes aeneus]|uniref:Uncharacterized protein n=1 Tax=Brassicogethes aeneus TaxID=1431903 RepID=A0A9P0FKR3_BRAAE|nr:unnamed protein product [Brassicogethes aeneus]